MKTDSVHQEPDEVNRSAVLIALGVSAALALVLGAWGWYATAQSFDGRRPSGIFPEATLERPHAVSQVIQGSFDTPREGESLVARAREELRSFAWVDRDAGVVRIPVDDAMDLVLDGADR